MTGLYWMAKEFDIRPICLAVARITFKGHSEWAETSCMARWRILFAIYVLYVQVYPSCTISKFRDTA